MNNSLLSTDTQAILLLCASFGQKRQVDPQPLNLSEYNLFANWLQKNKYRPADLFSLEFSDTWHDFPYEKLDIGRIKLLLQRGLVLSLAVEKWMNQGLWILGRGDDLYPYRLKQRLKEKSPPILYGIGNMELLSQGGLAIVGSRDITESEISYTQTIAKYSAQEKLQVISGGAKGVDQVAMLSCLESSGTVIGVLADSLAKMAVNGLYRQAIAQGRLVLISPYDPHAGFNTGNAMGRNKYIYGLADYGLVITSSYEKGGTWAGATEALTKIKETPIFVRMADQIPEGNKQLIKQGANPFYFDPNCEIRELLTAQLINEAILHTNKITVSISQPSLTIPPQDIYQAVLPLILNYLQQPINIETLAKQLEVKQGQLKDWLERAVKEGKVKKNNKPVRYVANQSNSQLSLLSES